MGYWGVIPSRLQHGTMVSLNDSLLIAADTTYYDVTSVSGSGLMIFANVLFVGNNNPHEANVALEIDGDYLHPSDSYEDLELIYGYDKTTRPLALNKMDNINNNSYQGLCWFFPNGVRFDTSYKIQCMMQLGLGDPGWCYTHTMYEAGVI